MLPRISTRGVAPTMGSSPCSSSVTLACIPRTYAGAPNGVGGFTFGAPCRRSSAQVMDLLQSVHRRCQALIASLELQRQIQRIVPGLMQIAAVKPQIGLLGGLPHVALFAL